MPGPGRKRKETGNQFESLIGQGERRNQEPMMADLMHDMDHLEKKHSRFGGSALQSSQEYQNVQQALGNVTFDMNSSFTNDVAANEKMVTQAIRNYYRLLAACEAYIAKPGGKSLSGRARKSKVKEIQKYAQRDLMGIEQVFFAMKSMDGTQQSSLNWDEILHSARIEKIEVEDYSSLQKLKANNKSDANAGRLMKEGVFTPETKGKVKDLNFKATAFNDSSIDQIIAEGGELNASNRNVATSRVANLIGLGSIVEQSRSVEVQSKGEKIKGNMMTFARGKDTKKRTVEDVRPITQKMDTLEEREAYAKAMLSPTLQKEISSLQVLDYLCGQGDRHTGNFFSEMENGKLTHIHGIDNDMAFGTGVDMEARLRADKGYHNTKQKMVVDSGNNLIIAHMDKQLAMNISDLKEAELRFVLKDLIEPVYLEATIERFKKLKEAVKKELANPRSRVLLNEGEWNESTHDDFIKQSRLGLHYKNTGDDAFTYKSGGAYIGMTPEERYEVSKGDSYYSELVMEMMGFWEQQQYFKKI